MGSPPPSAVTIGRMSDPSLDPAPLTAETPCTRCGYNLMGLPATGACPECGSAVEHSLHGDDLRHAAPAWLHTLTRGLALILWGVVISVLCRLLGTLFRDVPVAQRSIVFAGTLIDLYGIWLLTEPDPSGRTDPAGKTSVRQVARVALGIATLLALLSIVLVGLNSVLMIKIGVGVQLLTLIVALVGQVARLRLVGQLAARIPRYDLQRRALFLTKAIPITYGLFFVLVIPAWAAGPTRRPMGFVLFFGCIGLLMLVPYFIFTIADLILLFRFRRAILGQLPPAAGS